MIQTSSGYLAAVNSTSREWSARLASSGTAINAEIMSVTVHKGTRGDELNVGTMYAPYFEATVRGYSGPSLLGSVLTFDLGLDVSGTTEWATIATGTVISAKAQGVDLLLTLAGPISALGDQTIESTSTAVTDVVTEIQTKLGTTVTCRDGITSLTGTLAAAMTGQTIRGALQSLAAFFGGYVTEDATGQVVIAGMSQTSTTAISPDTYQEEPELSTGTYEITGWRVFVNSETYYLEGSEPYMDTACQFMTQAQFNAVKAEVIGQTFRGGALDQTLGNPLIEPWDVLSLAGSTDAMPRLGAVTITYDGGVSVRIESPVITDDEQPAQVVGPLSGQVAEAAAAANSAKTSAEEALETAQEVNNHFYVDSAGLHVTLLESSPNTGQNILIDSDGMDIRDGTTILASFTADGVTVGPDGSSKMKLSAESMAFETANGLQAFSLSSAGALETITIHQQLDPQYALKTVTDTAERWTWQLPNSPEAPIHIGFSNSIFPAGWTTTVAKDVARTYSQTIDGTTYSWTLYCSSSGEVYIEFSDGMLGTGLRSVNIQYRASVPQPQLAFGTGSEAGYAHQAVFGKYNDNQSGNLFEIGNGTSDTARSNALSVSSAGILSTRNPANTFGSIFDLIYPVGSVYMSVNSTDPGTLFGGSWQPIEDTFLLAAGTNHAAGSTGGEETVTLTAAQSGLPAHTHGFTQPTVNGGADSGAITGGTHGHTANYRSVYNGSSNYSAVSGTGGTGTTTGAIVSTSGSHTHDLPAHTHSVSGGAVGAVTGGAKAASSAHNNMPPYLAVYVWKRTA